MSPIEEIERALENSDGSLTEDSLMAMEETWCGRYVMIHDGNVYLDASSLLGVFYSDYGISSSVAVLAKAMGLEKRIWHPDKNLCAANFLMGVHTQYSEIKRLMASQVYNYKKKAIHCRQLLPHVSEKFANEEDRLRCFVELFTNSLKNMSKLFEGRKLLIALTGGYDSRALFALMHYAGLYFDCFTIQHDQISKGDVDIPKQLCLATGHKHHFVELDKKNFSKEYYSNYETHTAGLANDGDKIHYSYGQYQQLVDKLGECVLFRSSVWLNAIGPFWQGIEKTIDINEVCKWNYIKHDSMVRKSIEDYIMWAEGNVQKGLSKSNRFFWEQRTGNWMSSIEQSFDMMDGIVSLQMVNSRVLLDILLGFSKEELMVKGPQQRVTAFACPEILGIPYGVHDLAGKWRKLRGMHQKVKSLFARIEVMGVVDTIKMYSQIIKVKFESKKLKRS